MKTKEDMLKLMRFWLFGTFLIVFTAVTIYIGGALGTGLAIFRELYFWLSVVIALVLCVVWYLFYKWYLDRKES